MRITRALLLGTAIGLAAGPGWAQSASDGEGARPGPVEERRTERGGVMRAVSSEMGEMAVEAGGPAEDGMERLRFEPWGLRDEMFERDDVVFLMRHGPTDWSRLDEKDVAPGDCENQRIMSPEGREAMFEMGRLMAANDVTPSSIVVSEWCRNQQTLEELQRGFDAVEPGLSDRIPVETDPELNLLLALQGAPNVQSLRERIGAWEGSPEGEQGPLLVISHFTNIEELTTFTVYEGEMLVIDPARENRVLGYLRLTSAAPDVGHFEVEDGGEPVAQ